MAANPFNITLPTAITGDTWDGMTWTVSDVSPDDTEFAAALVTATFQLQDESGVPVLTLSSAVVGEVTINVATANEWSVTVESRILTLTPGVYSYGLKTVDADDVEKTKVAGILIIEAQPVL
jgi:hypothetical protein